jgi:hypothetical protein
MCQFPWTSIKLGPIKEGGIKGESLPWMSQGDLRVTWDEEGETPVVH